MKIHGFIWIFPMDFMMIWWKNDAKCGRYYGYTTSSSISPIKIWLHCWRCLYRRSADGTLVLHYGSKAARPTGIAWEMPTSSHLQPDKVAMKSQWIPWKSHEYPIQVATRNSWVLHVLGWRSGSTSLRTTARQAKALWFYTCYMDIFFRDTLRCHQT